MSAKGVILAAGSRLREWPQSDRERPEHQHQALDFDALVDPAGRGLIGELANGGHDTAPGSPAPSSSPTSASSLARAALSSRALSP
jgi:hypothetical protein